VPWPTVDSDPGAIFGMVRDFGVKGIDVIELYGTNREEWEPLK
jgi:hypothetical protein